MCMRKVTCSTQERHLVTVDFLLSLAATLPSVLYFLYHASCGRVPQNSDVFSLYFSPQTKSMPLAKSSNAHPLPQQFSESWTATQQYLISFGCPMGTSDPTSINRTLCILHNVWPSLVFYFQKTAKTEMEELPLTFPPATPLALNTPKVVSTLTCFSQSVSLYHFHQLFVLLSICSWIMAVSSPHHCSVNQKQAMGPCSTQRRYHTDTKPKHQGQRPTLESCLPEISNPVYFLKETFPKLKNWF